LAFNNFVLFDRVHRPIIGKRAAVVEEDLLSVRESARAKINAALISSPICCHLVGCGTPNRMMQSDMRSIAAAHMMP
jgi:hypothetical protein